MVTVSRGIRRHMSQIHIHQQQQRPNVSMLRYRKSIKTMYYIMGVFILCYLPSIVFTLATFGLKEAGISIGIAYFYAIHFALTFIMVNSALNRLFLVGEYKKYVTLWSSYYGNNKNHSLYMLLGFARTREKLLCRSSHFVFKSQKR